MLNSVAMEGVRSSPSSSPAAAPQDQENRSANFPLPHIPPPGCGSVDGGAKDVADGSSGNRRLRDANSTSSSSSSTDSHKRLLGDRRERARNNSSFSSPHVPRVRRTSFAGYGTLHSRLMS